MSLTGPRRASLRIHDAVGKNSKGEGVSFDDVARMLADAGPIDRIDLSVSSGGGLLVEGLGIYTALANHPAKVYVTVSGLAASSASLIVMAGDEIEMGAGSLMMIHNPILGIRGGRKELEAALSAWDKMKASAADIYAARSGQSPESVHAMMDSETWFSAEEAVAAGFATSVSPHKFAMSAELDLSHLGDNLPAAVVALMTDKTPVSVETPSVPEPVIDQKAIADQAVANYKATVTKFTATFGADAGMNYLNADMSFESALVKHLGKVNDDLAAAKLEVKAAKDETAAAKLALAAVKTPGEETPVPSTPAPEMKTPKGISRLPGVAAV